MTNENKEKIEPYLKEVRKYKTISIKEMESLHEKFMQGDLKARDQIIQSNLRLVITLVNKVNPRRMDVYEDMVQAGNEALIKSIYTWKSPGANLLTWCYTNIKFALMVYGERNKFTVRLPATFFLGEDALEVINQHKPISMETLVGDNNLRVEDLLKADDYDDGFDDLDKYNNDVIQHELSKLPKKESRILNMIYNKNMKKSKLSEKCGKNSSFITKMETEIFDKIRVKIKKRV